jgi:hypothetical protein
MMAHLCPKAFALALLLTGLAASLAAAAVDPRGDAKGGPVPDRFEQFVYLRNGNGHGDADTDSLVLVTLSANGAEARPVYSQRNLGGWHPLCVRGGILYGISLGSLVGVDLATGKAEELGQNIDSFAYQEGRLYALLHSLEKGYWLRVYDFAGRGFRDIAPWTGASHYSGDWEPQLRVSPDQAWLAWFAPSGSDVFSYAYQLHLVAIATGVERTCGERVPARVFETGGGDVAVGPPFAWQDGKTILVVRDLSKVLLSGMRVDPRPGQSRFDPGDDMPDMVLASLDIATGQMTDLVRLPQFEPEIGEPFFRTADAAGVPRVVLGHLGQYRLELPARRLVEDDSLGGDYRGQFGRDPAEVFFKTDVLDSARGIPEIAVAPDGSAMAWEAHMGMFRSMIRCHRASSSQRYDLAEERIPPAWASWCGRQPSLEGYLLWISSADLTPTAQPHLDAGWTRFSPQPAPPPPPVRGPDLSKDLGAYLSMALDVDRATYRLHESAVLTVTLANTSDQDVTFRRPRLYAGFFNVVCRPSAAGLTRAFDNPERVFPEDPVRIKAGQIWQQTCVLALCEPGEHEVTGTFCLREGEWRGQVQAEPLVFNVEHSPEDSQLFQAQFDRLLEMFRSEFAQDPMTCDYGCFRELGPPAVPLLVKAMESTQEPGFRERLGYAVERMPTPEVLPYCGRLLAGEMNSERTFLLEILMRVYRSTPAKEDALNLLVQALRHRAPGLRRETAVRLKTIGHPSVTDAFRTAIDDTDAPTALIAARYLAAAEEKDLAQWLGAAIAEPNKARYLAAQDIAQELETTWHQAFGPVPRLGWEEATKDPALIAAWKEVLKRWQQWAVENPRSSAAFFDADRQGWGDGR